MSEQEKTDTRIVQLKFDDKDFSKNAARSMSVLDKLNEKLKMGSATEGFKNLGDSMKKINMLNLANDVNTVTVSFNKMEAISTGVMMKIGSDIVGLGKKLAYDFTQGPREGLEEYESKLNSIRTIMSSTGETLDRTTAYIEELQTYADKTIYSFEDMTQNIGKFTNAGISLKDATTAIEGLSNEAALSGANVQEASRAMYNFSQSLSLGYVQLMDWKSIENANMATKDFKQNLTDMAVRMGTIKKEANGMYTAGGKTFSMMNLFHDGLQKQWLTSDVLINTLKEYNDETTEVGKKAAKASKQVNTFTKLFDTFKDQLKSGWNNKIFTNIFGNLDELTKTLTNISDYVGDKILGPMFDYLGGSSHSIWSMLNQTSSLTQEQFERMNDSLYSLGDKGVALSDQMAKSYLEVGIAAGTISKEGDHYVTTMRDANGQAVKFEGTAKGIYDSLGKVNWITDDINHALADGANPKLANVLKDIKTESGGILTQWHDLGGRESMINALANAWQALLSVMKPLGEAVKEVFFSFNGSDLVAWTKQVEAFTKALILNAEVQDTLKIVFKALLIPAKMFFTVIHIGALVVMAFVSTIVSVINKLEEIGSAIDEVIGKYIKPAKVELSGLGDILLLPLEAVLALLGKVKDAFDNFDPELFKANLEDFMNRCPNLVRFIILIGNGINKLKSGAANTLANIGKAVSNFKMPDIDWAKGINNFFGFILSIHDKVASALNKLVIPFNNLKEAIGNWFKTATPLKSFIEMLKNALAGAGAITDNVAETAKGVAVKAQTAGEKVKAFFSGILLSCQNFIKGMRGLGNNIKAFNKVLLEILNPARIIQFAWAAAALAMTVATTKMIWNLGNLLKEAAGFIENVKDIASNLVELIKSYTRLNNIKGIAIAVSSALISISVAMLIFSRIPTNKIGQATKALLVAMAGIAAMAVIFVILSKIDRGFNAKSFANSMAAISGAFLLMAGTMSILSQIDGQSALKNLGIFSILVAEMVAIAIIGNKFISGFELFNMNLTKGAKSVKAGLPGILLFAASMYIMVGALKKMSKINPSKFEKNIKGWVMIFVAMGILMGAAIIATKYGGFSNACLKMVTALGLLLFIAKRFSKLPISTIVKMEIVLPILLAALLGLVMITGIMSLFKNEEKNLKTFSSAMIKMALAANLMAIAIKIYAKMPLADLVKGASVCAALMLVFSLVMGLAGNLESGKFDMLKILGMITYIYAMILAINLINAMSVGEILKGLAVLTAIQLVFAFVLKMSSNMMDVKTGGMVSLIAAIIVMVAAVYFLSELDTGKMLAATAAISGMMVVFALCEKLIGSIKVINKSVIASVLGLAVVIAAIGLVITLMSTIGDPSKYLTIIASLALMLGAIVGVTAILSAIPNISKYALAGITLVGAIIAGIGLVMTKMASVKDASEYIQIAISLSLVLIALTGVTAILSVLGAGGAGMLKAALFGLTAFAIIVTGISGLFMLLSLIPDDVLKKAANTAQEIGSIIGQFFGGIAGGFKAAVAEQGAAAAEKLKDINYDGLIKFSDALGKLGASIALIPTTDGVVQWFTGKHDVRGLFSSLNSAGPDIVASADYLNKVNLNGLEQFSKILSILAGGFNTIPNTNGVAQWFTGKKDLASFVETIGELAKDLVAQQDNFASLTPSLSFGATRAAEVVKVIAEAAKDIPNSGGLLGNIVGNNDLDDFAYMIGRLAKILSDQRDNFNKVDDDLVTSTEKAGNIVIALAKAAKAIPNSGGLLGDIVGNNDLGTFAEQIGTLAVTLSYHQKDLEKCDNSMVTAVQNAGNCVEALAVVAKDIPNENGAISWFTGDNSLSDFATEIGSMASIFAEHIDDFKSFNSMALMVGVSNAIQTIAGMAAAAENIPQDSDLKVLWGAVTVNDKQGLASFAKEMVKAAPNLVKFGKKLAGFDVQTVNAATSVLSAYINMANTVAGNSTNGLKATDTQPLMDFLRVLPDIAKALVSFSSDMQNFKAIDVNPAVIALTQLASIKNVNLNADRVNTFSTGLNSMADALVKMSSKLVDVNSIDPQQINSITNNLKSMASKLAALNPDDFTKASDSLKAIAKVSIKGFIKAFTDQNNKVDLKAGVQQWLDSVGSTFKGANKIFIKRGNGVISNFASGMLGQQDTLNKTGKSIMASLCAALALYNSGKVLDKNTKNSVMTPFMLGKFFISGIIDGMNDTKERLYGSVMGISKNMVKVSAKALDEHSPSKEAIKQGVNWIFGMIKGLNSKADDLYNSIMHINKDSFLKPLDSLNKMFKTKGFDLGDSFGDITTNLKNKMAKSNIGGAIDSAISDGGKQGKSSSKKTGESDAKEILKNLIGAGRIVYEGTQAFLNKTAKDLGKDGMKVYKALGSMMSANILKLSQDQHSIWGSYIAGLNVDISKTKDALNAAAQAFIKFRDDVAGIFTDVTKTTKITLNKAIDPAEIKKAMQKNATYAKAYYEAVAVILKKSGNQQFTKWVMDNYGIADAATVINIAKMSSGEMSKFVKQINKNTNLPETFADMIANMFGVDPERIKMDMDRNGNLVVKVAEDAAKKSGKVAKETDKSKVNTGKVKSNSSKSANNVKATKNHANETNKDVKDINKNAVNTNKEVNKLASTMAKTNNALKKNISKIKIDGKVINGITESGLDLMTKSLKKEIQNDKKNIAKYTKSKNIQAIKKAKAKLKADQDALKLTQDEYKKLKNNKKKDSNKIKDSDAWKTVQSDAAKEESDSKYINIKDMKLQIKKDIATRNKIGKQTYEDITKQDMDNHKAANDRINKVRKQYSNAALKLSEENPLLESDLKFMVETSINNGKFEKLYKSRKGILHDYVTYVTDQKGNLVVNVDSAVEAMNKFVETANSTISSFDALSTTKFELPTIDNKTLANTLTSNMKVFSQYTDYLAKYWGEEHSPVFTEYMMKLDVPTFVTMMKDFADNPEIQKAMESIAINKADFDRLYKQLTELYAAGTIKKSEFTKGIKVIRKQFNKNIKSVTKTLSTVKEDFMQEMKDAGDYAVHVGENAISGIAAQLNRGNKFWKQFAEGTKDSSGKVTYSFKNAADAVVKLQDDLKSAATIDNLEWFDYSDTVSPEELWKKLQSNEKAGSFYDMLDSLLRKGLSPDIIRTIAKKGPASGWGIAEGLTHMTEAELERYSDAWDRNNKSVQEAVQKLTDSVVDATTDKVNTVGVDTAYQAGDTVANSFADGADPDENKSLDDTLKESGIDLTKKVADGATSDKAKKQIADKANFLTLDAATFSMHKFVEYAKKALEIKGPVLVSKFKSLGLDCAKGLSEGLTSAKSIKIATDAGAKLGNAAHKGAKKKVKSNSPAKAFIELGEYCGEGLAIGLQNWYNKVADSGSQLGGTLTDAVKSSIQPVFTDDMDLNPIITPTMDLTELDRQAGTITDFFNRQQQLKYSLSQNGINSPDFTSDLADAVSKGLQGNTDNRPVTINVYGADGQDVNELADIIMDKFASDYQSRQKARA